MSALRKSAPAAYRWDPMPAFDQDVGFTRTADGVRVACAVHGSGFRLVRAAGFHPPPHDFLDGELRAAWLADADGNAIEIVQRRH